MAADKQLGFEESMIELESILQKMSSNDTTLNESVEMYENAAKLIRVCHEDLQNAQLRVDEIGNIAEVLEGRSDEL